MGAVAGKTAHPSSIGKAVRVIAKLAEDAGAQDGSKAGEAGDDRRLGVLVKQGGEFGFERRDGLADRGDHLDQPKRRYAQGVLDGRGLA